MNNANIMIKYAHNLPDKHLVVSRSCTCIRLLCNMTTYVKNHSEGGRFNPGTPNTVTHRHECRWLYFIRMEKNKKYSNIHHIHIILITNARNHYVFGILQSPISTLSVFASIIHHFLPFYLSQLFCLCAIWLYEKRKALHG